MVARKGAAPYRFLTLFAQGLVLAQTPRSEETTRDGTLTHLMHRASLLRPKVAPPPQSASATP